MLGLHRPKLQMRASQILSAMSVPALREHQPEDASLDLLDVLGMHQDGRDAGLLDGLERSFPIDAGALHQRSTHPVLLQPLDEFADAGGKGAELPGPDVRVLSGPRDPHGRRDLYLVNVKARCARVDDIETVIFYHVASSFKGG